MNLEESSGQPAPDGARWQFIHKPVPVSAGTGCANKNLM